MKDLKQDILDALHDATNLDNGRVSVPYFTELLDGILTEQCNIANVVGRSEQLPCEHEYKAIYLGMGYVRQCQKCGDTQQ